MNERIKELALQAWMTERLEKDPKYQKSELTEYLLNGLERFHEKFAELIVKECLSIVENNNPRSPGITINNFDTGWQLAVETKSNRIRQHFGVQE